MIKRFFFPISSFCKYPMMALAALLCLIVSTQQVKAQETITLPLENYVPDGVNFIGTADWDTKKVLTVEMDLSGCLAGKEENVLSIGSDIKKWYSSGNYNIHLYYTASTKILHFDFVNDKNGKSEQDQSQNYEVKDPSSVIVVFSANGISVNGTTINSKVPVVSNIMSQSTIQVGSLEGGEKKPSHATYKSIRVEDEKDLLALPLFNYTPNGAPFSVDNITFSEDNALEAVIDLSTCTGKAENILSIGNKIEEWAGAGLRNLHLYYTKSSGELIVDWVNQDDYYGSASDPKREFKVSLGTNYTLRLKLTKDGFYINGERLTDTWLDQRFPKQLYDLGTIQVGSRQGKSRSNATYKALCITPPYLSGYAPEGKAFTLPNIPWGKEKVLEADIDLTNCTGEKENILSIGNDIKEWDKAGCRNLHFYYTKSSNKLIVDWVNPDDPKASSTPKEEIEVNLGTNYNVKIQLTNHTLLVNGRVITTSWLKQRFPQQLYNLNEIQVGSENGDVRSNAIYNNVSVRDTVSYGPLPWKNIQADGTATFKTTEAFDFAKQKIVAKIDLSKCVTHNAISSDVISNKASDDETIFQIGTNIDIFGSLTDNNLHFYYNPATGKGTIDLVNNDTGSGKVEQTFTVPADKKLTLEFSYKGLFINGTRNDNLSNRIWALLEKDTLQIGSVQGDGYRSSALYESVSIEPLADNEMIDEITLPQENYTPSVASKMFISNISNTDFNKATLKAEIDLSKCTADKDDNIFSIGTHIEQWGGGGIYNLHFYYNGTKKVLKADWLDNSPEKNEKLLKGISGTIKLAINADGLFINDTQALDATTLANLFSHSDHLYIGGGTEKFTGTSASYPLIELTTEKEVTLPIENFKPDGSKFSVTSPFGNDKAVVAYLDLTTCKNENENVLSIGNNIDVFGSSEAEEGAYNLHFYYSPSAKKLEVDFADRETYGGSPGHWGYKKEPTDSRISIVDPSNVKIVVWRGGVYVNGTLLDRLTTPMQANFWKLPEITIGSRQGTTRSNATYKLVRVDQSFAEHLPWTGAVAHGDEMFMTTEPIDFNRKYVEAEIDLNACSGTAENIFSIGNNIEIWGNENGAKDKYNLHFYYNANTKEVQINLLDLSLGEGSSTGQALRRTYTVGDSKVLKIKLSKDGLSLDDTEQKDYTVALGAHLLKLSEIQVGGVQGKMRSNATYNSVAIKDLAEEEWIEHIDIPQENYTPTYASKKFYANLTGVDFAQKKLVAEIDLTNCKTDENILSIGERIEFWKNDKYKFSNIHLYYIGDNKVKVDFIRNGTFSDGNSAYRQRITLDGSFLKLELSEQGLAINGTVVWDAAKVADLFKNGTPLALGSMEGTKRSNALYKSLRIEDLSVEDLAFSYITDPQVTDKHKETGHATFIPYANAADMQADKAFYAQPWVQPDETKALVKSLNGQWKFNYTPGTAAGPAPTPFFAADYDDTAWKEIKVPLSWEMAGYGRPVYTNIGYPFKSSTPPYALESKPNTQETDHNATGFYRRTFSVPEGWSDKRVFLHFDGVTSAAMVWVNGKFIGYSEGSNNDAEFDITKALKTDGSDNQLSVRVYRWCDGSYLEGQDMWHLAGIHRDVYLVATPSVFVSDHYITAPGLSDDATKGSLNVAMTIDNRGGITKIAKVKVILKDASGKEIKSAQGTYNSAQTESLNVLLKNLTNLKPWSAENPYLYTVEVIQMDDSDKEEMAFSTKYGFRNIKITGTKLTVNGERVFFKGVNGQDIHPEYGHAIDLQTMLKDVTMMKRANINTYRTSHYPRQAKMYAIFDAYGMYVMDEADVECHGNQSLSGNADWKTSMIDRTERMVLRDRNHPCIFAWSLGNESGAGSNFQDTYDRCKALDARPVHYEGAANGTNDEDVKYSDFRSYMYPAIWRVENYAKGKKDIPRFLCEYAHAMGQAVGNLQEYWDIMEASDNFIGGCIWDWVDQAIYDVAQLQNGVKTKNGFHLWTAGYDYNTMSGSEFQGNFLDNGLVTPDRKWSAKLIEVKHVYQYAAFKRTADKTVEVTNKMAFTNLNAYDFIYQVLKDGRIVEEGAIDGLDVEPGQKQEVDVPFTTDITDNKGEYSLNVELRLKENTLWADKGYEVARQQFLYYAANDSLPTLEAHQVKGGSITLNGNTVSGTTANGNAFEVSFADDGKMTAYTFNGQKLISKGLDFNSLRNTDNDLNFASAQETSSKSTSIASAIAVSGNQATLRVTGTATNCSFTIDYTIYADATVDAKVTFTPSGDTRRLGLGMQFAPGFENVEYYARGPWSNYTDRKTGSFLGRYATTIDDMIEENIHPQTYGDHQDLRELTLRNAATGLSLNVKTAGLVAFSLSHFNDEQWCGVQKLWSNKQHWYDLTKDKQVYAHFDYWQRGLGNNSCSAEQSLEKYRCKTSGTYSYTLRFTPGVAE